MTEHTRIALGGLIMFLAVAAGAFGSHGLERTFSPRNMEVWNTAVLYHLIHGVALLVILALEHQHPSRMFTIAWATMLAGVILFSGSLYLIALTGMRWPGPITPVGGLALLISWLLVAWAGIQSAGR